MFAPAYAEQPGDRGDEQEGRDQHPGVEVQPQHQRTQRGPSGTPYCPVLPGAGGVRGAR